METPALVRRRRLPAVLRLATLLLLVGPALATDVEEGSPTDPRELVALLGELEEHERYGEILGLVTPGQREAYVFVSWLGAAYDALGGEPEVVAAYRAIVRDHELDEAWLGEDATGDDGVRRLASQALRGVDLAPLLHDLAAFRRAHGRFGVAFGFDGELRALHVEEDWALARIERAEHELRRCEGAWTWCPFPELEEEASGRVPDAGPGPRAARASRTSAERQPLRTSP